MFHLITVNCAILGGSLFMVEREYTALESTVYGFSSGIGWLLAIVGIAAIRKKIKIFSHSRWIKRFRHNHDYSWINGYGIYVFCRN